jgi:hypothetical protein
MAEAAEACFNPGMTTRRGFLKTTLGGAALLAAAGAVPLALRRTRLRELPPGKALLFFTPAEYAVFAAVADRILAIPEGAQGKLRSAPTPAQVDVAGKADAFLAPLPPDDAKQMKQLLALFDNALFGLLTGGAPTPFTQQGPAQQDAQLRGWASSRLGIKRSGYQALKRLACAIYFGSPETWPSASYAGPPDVSAVKAALKAKEQQQQAQAAPAAEVRP